MIARAVAVAFAAVCVSAGGALATPPAWLPVTAQGGCLSQDASGWVVSQFTGYCTYSPLLKSAGAVAVSPDGKNVYVVSRYANALVAYARDPATGTLTQLPQPGGCFTKHGSDGCAVGRALWQPVGVVVSPDGLNVYVASKLSNGVAVFARDRYGSGALTQLSGTKGCITATGSGGDCAKGRALAGARALAVGGLADVASYVFVASVNANGVAVLKRNLFPGGGGDGSLTQQSGQAGCVEHRGNEGCADGRALMGPDGIVADQTNVYLASGGTGGLAVFRIAGSNGLLQLGGTSGCLTADGSGGVCTKARAVEAAFAIAESPDRRNVYVTRGGGPEASTSIPDSGLAIFTRAADGSLHQPDGVAGCITVDGREGCGQWWGWPYVDPPINGMLAVGADATYLGTFVATRTSDGSLVDLADGPWGGDWWPDAAAITADGRNLYVLGVGSSSHPVGHLVYGIQVYRRAGT